MSQINEELGLVNNKTRTSKVGAISKAQKAQNIFREKRLEIFENFFLSKNVKGDLFGFNIQSVAKYQKTRRGDPLGT